MNENGKELEIRIQDVLFAMLKRWWVIAMSVIIGAGILFGYSYASYVPKYEATAKMYVNNDSITLGSTKVSISASEIAAAQSLVNTYCEILKARLTLEEVIDRTGLDYTYEQLHRMVKAGPVEGTEVFYITVTSTDPDEAKLIANTIVQVLPVKIATIIDGSSVRTVDEAVRGKEISPGFTRDAVMGAMIGLALSLGLVFAFDVFINDTMESEDWVLSAYREEIPLLTVIPDVNAPAGKRYGRYGKYSRYGKYYEKHYYAAIEREK